MGIRKSKSNRVFAASATALLLSVSVLSTTVPARAGDDGSDSMLNTVLGFVGIDTDKDKDRDQIDYRERAPLVLPPKYELPAPSRGADRNGQWPNDPDVAARRRAAADARRPAPQNGLSNSGLLGQQELRAGRGGSPNANTQSDCMPGSNNPACLYTPWEQLKAKKEAEADVVVSGQEPGRNYLTEPPTGYRKPTKTVKATQAAPGPQDDPADAKAYIRNERNKRTVADD